MWFLLTNFISTSGLDPLYYNDKFRLLFQHKLWWRWRTLLKPFVGLHLAIAITHLRYDQLTLSPMFLDTLVVLLAVANIVIWFFIFRDPYKLFHFHRPSKGYRWAVYIISAATSIPSLILHIMITFLSSKINSCPVCRTRPLAKMIRDLGFGLSVTQLSLLLAVSSLNLWMVRRFLLSEDEEHYEPTVPFPGTRTVSASSSRRQSVSAAAALEPYSGSSTSTSSYESHLSPDGHLSKAYAMQWASDPLPTCELDEDLHGQSSGATDTELMPKPRDSSAPNPSESTIPGSTDNNPTSPFRCRTVARFDYMCWDRIGPHSWFSYPLVPVILGIYSTVLFGLVSIFVYENRYLRFPSPNARCSLLAPLGGYLFCGYAIKRELRKSLFSRSHISLPEPWVEITSLVGKPVFIESDTGASTSVDPRLRAFPIEGQDRRAGIRSSEYMKAYNASPSTCKEYWGHLGRAWTTGHRCAPTIFQLFFLGFASFLFAKGSIYIFKHRFNPDNDKRLSDITIPNLQRLGRMIDLKITFMISVAPFVFLIAFYALGSMMSVLSLWASSRRELRKQAH